MGVPRFLDGVVDQERARPRFLASLLVAFATFAGLLALVGMYGAIAYAVRQRERGESRRSDQDEPQSAALTCRAAQSEPGVFAYRHTIQPCEASCRRR
jgi:hypothetical protein